MSKLTKDDKKVWKYATKDVKKEPHVERDIDDFTLDDFASPPCFAAEFELYKPQPAKVIKPKHLVEGELNYLDKTKFAKLEKGQIRAEAILDLHGLKLDEARIATTEFVEFAKQLRYRCVLIITGKSGAIKKEFPMWVNMPEISRYILSFTHAPARHGGSGAYYLYLKKS